MVKNPPAMQQTWVQPLSREDPLEKGVLPTQYFSLENSMDRGTWQATVRVIAKSWIGLSDFHFTALKLRVVLLRSLFTS